VLGYHWCLPLCVLLAVVKCASYLCLCAYCVNLLSTLDSNDAGFLKKERYLNIKRNTRDKLTKASHLNLLHL
jgi:hypothetical protein